MYAIPGAAIARDWIYVAERGDNLWDLATEYLVSMRYWAQFRALNDVPNPRQMPPGTEVTFPMEWLVIEAAPVEIAEVAGDAKIVRAAGGDAERAVAGKRLHAGDRVVTDAAQSVVLAFVDGSELLVRPQSDLTVEEAGRYGRTRRVVSRSRLGTGRVEGEVPGLSAAQPRFEVTTPSASAVVRGTRFRVGSEGEPPVARTEVENGTVEVASEAGRVTLPAGTGTVVRAGERPARARALLDPVDLGALPARFERRQLRIGWPAHPAASGYRVQISRSAEAVVLLDEAVETPRVTLPDLADGLYVLKVRGVDELGLEGREASHAFELDARPEPPATISPRLDETVRIVRPTLRWAATSEAQAYRVQVFAAGAGQPVLDVEAHPGTRIEIPQDLADGPYTWRVATRDANDDLGPFGDTQRFAVRKAPPAPDAEAEAGEEGVALRWQAGLPGQSYEIQFADDEGFTEGARIEAAQTPQTTIDPPQDILWFRVRIVDVDGYRGPFGTAQRIEPEHDDPWWLALLPLLLLLAL